MSDDIAGLTRRVPRAQLRGRGAGCGPRRAAPRAPSTLHPRARPRPAFAASLSTGKGDTAITLPGPRPTRPAAGDLRSLLVDHLLLRRPELLRSARGASRRQRRGPRGPRRPAARALRRGLAPRGALQVPLPELPGAPRAPLARVASSGAQLLRLRLSPARDRRLRPRRALSPGDGRADGRAPGAHLRARRAHRARRLREPHALRARGGGDARAAHVLAAPGRRGREGAARVRLVALGVFVWPTAPQEAPPGGRAHRVGGRLGGAARGAHLRRAGVAVRGRRSSLRASPRGRGGRGAVAAHRRDRRVGPRGAAARGIPPPRRAAAPRGPDKARPDKARPDKAREARGEEGARPGGHLPPRRRPRSSSP